MEKQELAAFVEWLPSNVEEFKDKNPEEVVTMLNELSQTDEGVNVISNLINQFKERTQMFEQGGKLNFLVEKFKKGGTTKKENKEIIKEGRKSDKFNRVAYRNMKSALKEQNLGLTRLELKSAAMNNILGTNQDTPKTSLKMENNPIVPKNFTALNTSIKKDIEKEELPKIKTQQIPDLTGSTFSQAFSAARKGGLSTFKWNGKLYGTQLATSSKIVTKPNLPNVQLSNPLNITEANKQGIEAAKGIRPKNMEEGQMVNNPSYRSYSDYILMSNLGNPNRFDSRYIGPKTISTKENNNSTHGYIPIEYRINPRQLSSFLKRGGLLSKNFFDKLEELKKIFKNKL